MELADVPPNDETQDERLKKFCHGYIAVFAVSKRRGHGFRGVDWYFALRLADAWAWEKLGTRPHASWPEEERARWNGAYWPGSGQLIDAVDAKNFAGALRRALKARDELKGDPQRAAGAKGQLLKFLVFDLRQTVENIVKLLESGECLLPILKDEKLH